VADTTEQRRLESLLRDAQRFEGIGRLVGGIAHDFNNLLLVILATTELTRREARDPMVEPELDRIEEAAIRAADLVRQLLVFARGRKHKPEPVDLGSVLPQTSRLLERVLGDEVELRLELPEAGTLWPIVADRGEIEQVVLNLAINARDAMPGGGKIEISARNAASGDPLQRPCVVLAIQDTGSGMDPETLERIFEPFFSTKSWGTGLGLATCKTIIERAGGFIRARSAAGAGSIFELVFPRAAGNPLERTALRATNLARGSERVLVVDDSDAVRAVARRLLAHLGYQVLTARSASEARVALKSRTTPVDLLITDLVMPGENGVLLARRARAHNPRLGVLLVSARAQAIEELEHEFGPMLPKPFTLEQLASAVRTALKGRPEANSSIS
jgi:two-component system, cell cycle sensor histidine kinase and response regulator CckA